MSRVVLVNDNAPDSDFPPTGIRFSTSRRVENRQQVWIFLRPRRIEFGHWGIPILPGRRNDDSCWQKVQYSTQAS